MLWSMYIASCSSKGESEMRVMSSQPPSSTMNFARLKVEVGFLDLGVELCVPAAVVHAREMAVEFLGADGLAHLVEQFAVVFGGPHAPVPTGVDVGHVQHRMVPSTWLTISSTSRGFPTTPATGGLDADLDGVPF